MDCRLFILLVKFFAKNLQPYLLQIFQIFLLQIKSNYLITNHLITNHLIANHLIANLLMLKVVITLLHVMDSFLARVLPQQVELLVVILMTPFQEILDILHLIYMA